LTAALAALAMSAGAPLVRASETPAPAWLTQSSWPLASLKAQPGSHQFVTTHRGVFGARAVAYKATVAEAVVKDKANRPAASVYTLAYTTLEPFDPATRPVLFIYNGGPGSGSAFLNFGAFGPKRMARMSFAAQADPQTPLVDNESSVLDVADLVFLDPPDTGFSRTLPGVAVSTFRNGDADSAACAQVISQWLETHGRLRSPIYLAGESLGTHRNILLARDLRLVDPQINLAGLIMVSGPVPAPKTADPDPLEAVNRVINMSAWAWYWGKIDNQGQSLAQAVAKAHAFAQRDYVHALLLGHKLDDGERRTVAARLAEITGLPAAYYLDNALVIRAPLADLLKRDGKLPTTLDIRQAEDAATAPTDETRDWQAATRGVQSNMARYSRLDLGVEGLGDYYALAPDAIRWAWDFTTQPVLQQILAKQLADHPELRVLVGVGLYDGAASMGADEYVFSHMGAKGQSMLTYYAAGHMLYTDPPGQRAFMGDVRAFIQRQPVPGGAIPDTKPGRPSSAGSVTGDVAKP
jgi:carboxypeptidase C (cathepsin A)